MKGILFGFLILSSLSLQAQEDTANSESKSHNGTLTEEIDNQTDLSYNAHRRHNCRHRHGRGTPGPTGPTGPQGPQGIPGPVRLLTNTIFVDVNTTSTQQDGSIGNPYSSIQAAINTIPPATNVFEKARGFTILIASGIYPEDLVLTLNNNQIELVALGPVFLLKSVTPLIGANVTINFIATALPDPVAIIGDSVIFISLAGNTFFNNQNSIGDSGTFEILGTLFINDTSSVPNPGVVNFVSFKGSIIGGIDGTGSTKNNRLDFDNVVVFNVNVPSSIVDARDSLIGNFTALTYGVIYSSDIANGMTITQAPSVFTSSGAGIYSSSLRGTFSGPAGTLSNSAFLFDGASNYWFNVNGSTIQLPASKQILFDNT